MHCVQVLVASICRSIWGVIVRISSTSEQARQAKVFKASISVNHFEWNIRRHFDWNIRTHSERSGMKGLE